MVKYYENFTKKFMDSIVAILIATGLASLIGLEREMRMQFEGNHDYF